MIWLHTLCFFLILLYVHETEEGVNIPVMMYFRSNNLTLMFDVIIHNHYSENSSDFPDIFTNYDFSGFNSTTTGYAFKFEKQSDNSTSEIHFKFADDGKLFKITQIDVYFSRSDDKEKPEFSIECEILFNKNINFQISSFEITLKNTSNKKMLELFINHLSMDFGNSNPICKLSRDVMKTSTEETGIVDVWQYRDEYRAEYRWSQLGTLAKMNQILGSVSTLAIFMILAIAILISVVILKKEPVIRILKKLKKLMI
ncbi:hypothetical protein RF11_14086 [Thelohanellus kitauei]|uniref:Uncharacterized protein n=1 Tax=Thelohanellus kitauei TaxID=669202 RepID=A0A0C2MN57_THEKT|nr:hypothetical protein RF11_14086 [Thelohanellus kitauei]